MLIQFIIKMIIFPRGFLSVWVKTIQCLRLQLQTKGKDWTLPNKDRYHDELWVISLFNPKPQWHGSYVSNGFRTCAHEKLNMAIIPLNGNRIKWYHSIQIRCIYSWYAPCERISRKFNVRIHTQKKTTICLHSINLHLNTSKWIKWKQILFQTNANVNL